MNSRSAGSFTVSAFLHGSVLAWVAFSAAGLPVKPRSLYDQEIRPYEDKIVWYPMAGKLPEISPAAEVADRRPLRADVKAKQAMVSGAKDDPNPGPMIWTPEQAPKPVEPPQLNLPNLVAVAPAKVVRPFVAPPDIVQPPPKLPDPPRVEDRVDAAPLPVEVKSAKPAPRTFVPPEEKHTRKAVQLADAPAVAEARVQPVPLPVDVKGARPARAFVPPPEVRMARQAALLLPEAPEARAMVVEANALPFAAGGVRPRPRDFVAPPGRQPHAAPAAFPAPPETGNRATAHDTAVALPRGFVTPPSRPVGRAVPPVSAEAPEVNATSSPSAEATMAIVGLNPADTREAPPPPASHAAGFSSGPVERKDGSSGATNGLTLLNVPGLTVRDGPKDKEPTMIAPPFAPTSRENLMAAARIPGSAPAMGRLSAEAKTPRSVEAPDPRLAGRVIYSIAIQMPNVTSYSGSWQVWFAEREPVPGMQVDMRAPAPLRKVDPKYVASAAADRVEGVIRLAALIRKDGRVEQISLIRHLDDRLDRTAQEALAKWEFTPAARNGVPVDVDAVFEIPFHLAPRPGR